MPAPGWGWCCWSCAAVGRRTCPGAFGGAPAAGPARAGQLPLRTAAPGVTRTARDRYGSRFVGPGGTSLAGCRRSDEAHRPRLTGALAVGPHSGAVTGSRGQQVGHEPAVGSRDAGDRPLRFVLLPYREGTASCGRAGWRQRCSKRWRLSGLRPSMAQPTAAAAFPGWRRFGAGAALSPVLTEAAPRRRSPPDRGRGPSAHPPHPAHRARAPARPGARVSAVRAGARRDLGDRQQR